MVICYNSNNKTDTLLLLNSTIKKYNAAECCKYLVNTHISEKVDFDHFSNVLIAYAGVDFQMSLLCHSGRPLSHFLLASGIANENQIF